ncbi:Elongation factor 2 [Glycine soja]|uniref:Elongation factor 2 n=1 Tax=Glycine soja TaxID=3848 RepID=A0A445JFX0_GLYSO|nr:Elongation factor 2 [Glycine soja]
MSKSPNRHNRLYMEARPMEAGLAEAIDDEKIGPGVAPKIGLKYCQKCLVGKRIWTRKYDVLAPMRRWSDHFNCARRACYAAMLTAKPRLLEPVYLVEIQAPDQALDGAYSVLNQKRGHVFEECQRPGTPLHNVKAYLPPSDPLEPVTPAAARVAEIRRKKGFDVEMRPLSEFEDRL